MLDIVAFDIKGFCDRNVMNGSVMGEGEHKLIFHTVLWNGDPPKEILVFLLAEPVAWGAHVQRLLVDGWRFDFLREHAVVALEGKKMAIFGGDGAPYFDPSGMSSVRLWRKTEDGTQLILQVGSKWESGAAAAAGVKAFFGLFDEGPLEMVAKFSTSFGSA